MDAPLPSHCTAFRNGTKLACGTPADLARLLHADPAGVLVFDDATGKPVDLDWRLRESQPRAEPAADAPRKRGRPRLGVTAREITLLPRHWDWLALQPGGASQALRRLVDEARRADGGRTARRAAQERAYRVMSALGGDYPGFEEASRQLFAGNESAFCEAISAWPADMRDYLHSLLQPREDDFG